MPILLNKSAASKYAYLGSKLFAFHPASLVSVSEVEMTDLKKIPLIAECLDNGTLINGAEARAVSADAKKEIKSLDKKKKKGD